MKRLVLISIFAPLLIVGACTPAEQDTAQQEADTLQSDITQEMRDWRDGVETALDDIDEGIDSLEVQAETAAEDIEPEMNSALAELREQRDSLQQDLDQLGTAAEGSFEDLRADIEMKLEELEQDLQAARDRFREDDEDPQTS